MNTDKVKITETWGPDPAELEQRVARLEKNLTVHDLARDSIDIWRFMRELEQRIAALETDTPLEKHFKYADLVKRIAALETKIK
jgi:hypothetical protein